MYSIKDRHKHSSFASSFPVYLYNKRTEEVPDEEEAQEAPAPAAAETEDAEDAAAPEETAEAVTENDEEEGVVEDVVEEAEEATPEPPKMKTITVEEWIRLNGQAPLWQR